MKVLVTGISGFVGSNLATRYAELGHDVTGHWRGSNLTELLQQTLPDLILHCAAEIYDPEQMFDSNIAMTWQCLDHVRRHRCQMIYMGSSSEYGWRDCITQESTPVQPHTAYAGSKCAGTYMCQGWAQEFGLDVVTMRLYSIYGPGERPHRLFPRLWMAFRLGRSMDLVDGVHDFVYIDDTVDAIVAVAQSPQRTPGEIINVCSGTETTNQEVLHLFQEIEGHPAPVNFLGDQFVTQPVWQGDNQHLRTTYGWSPRHDLRSGIQDFLSRAQYE